MQLCRQTVLATMADDLFREEIISKFFLDTCRIHSHYNENGLHIGKRYFELARHTFRRADDLEYEYIPLTTGSITEFYIEPMLSCVGDADIMCHRSNQLAIPSGCTPPTQLPGEFGSHVEAYEIVNSEFPGYVYLWLSYLLTECVYDGQYNAVQCERLLAKNGNSDADTSRHGPALVKMQYAGPYVLKGSEFFGIHHANSPRSVDSVFCMRCLFWPPQAADWPTRHRNHDWPDWATIDHVVRNGCDVVGVAHRLCRQDKWSGKHQWRLSFSRAEIVLLNSWMPVQQIVYHMLRMFMKTERLTVSSSNSGSATLSNYNIKTLMLWACELKSKSWWTDDLNLVRICVELLQTLAVWLTDARCEHYFISSCNLFDQFENSSYTQGTVNILMSITRAWFCQWYIDNYIHKCAQLCPSSVSSLLQDSFTRTPSGGLHRLVCLQNALSAVVKHRLDMFRALTMVHFLCIQNEIVRHISHNSLTLRLCSCWMRLLDTADQCRRLIFTAFVFLHGAYKTTQGSLTDEMLDVLATTCLQSNDTRRCLNARNSSVLSLSQAATLMKVVANNSRSTVQLIEIELAKAYLHRALRCKDSDTNSINCLANVYLAVLYYTTGQCQMAMDHCTLVTMDLRDHSQCSSHIVQGELLPRIDDQVDSVVGLAVFYWYIRAAALNEEHDRRHVSVFTTELFAHYLHTKLLSVIKCHQFLLTSLTDEIPLYRNCFYNSAEIFVTDVMLFRLAPCTKCPSKDHLLMTDRGETKSVIHRQLDTSKLVELLQQSAVEHATVLSRHELEANSTVPSNLCIRALYAHKCGKYQHCLQLSICNVRSLIVNKYQFCVVQAIEYPEQMQMIGDEIVSLLGLTALIKHSHNSDRPRPCVAIHELSLSLYLMTQCQIKLRHSVTSLATTLDYVRLARCNDQMLRPVFDGFLRRLEFRHTLLNQHVLKFAEQKILRYTSVSHQM